MQREGILSTPAPAGAFSAFLGGDQRPRRRSLTVGLSVLLHALALSTALLWGVWRAEELDPKRAVEVIVWRPPAVPSGGGALAERSSKPPSRKPRPARAAVVLPSVERPPPSEPVGPTSDRPGPDGPPGQAPCPPGQECSGEDGPRGDGDPPRALPPSIGEKSCLSCPPPELPPAFKRPGVSLLALVKICVDAEGAVRSVQVLRGISPGFDAALVATIGRWRYRPHAINGRPVPFCYATRFIFQVH